MKAKFFFFLILIIAVGGSVFYFGWIQFQLPERTYGVIFTKTGGWDDEVLRPGEFSWRWERLIPTNMSLYRVPLHRQTVTIEKEGTLPSGKIYATVLEEEARFDYALELRLIYNLKVELLPELVREGGLEPATMEKWYEGLNRQIASRAVEIIEEEAQRMDTKDSALYELAELQESLLTKLSEDFVHVDFETVEPRHLEIPDPALYRAAREYYLGVLEAREEVERTTIEQERSWMVSEGSKLEILEKYGKLFTDYPGLIRYFSLKESDEFKELLPSVDLLREKNSEAQ